jgi:hypothetical protein
MLKFRISMPPKMIAPPPWPTKHKRRRMKRRLFKLRFAGKR